MDLNTWKSKSPLATPKCKHKPPQTTQKPDQIEGKKTATTMTNRNLLATTSHHPKIWALNHQQPTNMTLNHQIGTNPTKPHKRKPKKWHTNPYSKPTNQLRTSGGGEVEKGWDERSPPPLVVVARDDIWGLEELDRGKLCREREVQVKKATNMMVVMRHRKRRCKGGRSGWRGWWEVGEGRSNWECASVRDLKCFTLVLTVKHFTCLNFTVWIFYSSPDFTTKQTW